MKFELQDCELTTNTERTRGEECNTADEKNLLNLANTMLKMLEINPTEWNYVLFSYFNLHCICSVYFVYAPTTFVTAFLLHMA